MSESTGRIIIREFSPLIVRLLPACAGTADRQKWQKNVSAGCRLN